MTTQTETFAARGMQSAPPTPEYVYRVCYADHVPVTEWTVTFAHSFNEAARVARTHADRDNAPGSGVEANVIVVERYAPDISPEEVDDTVWDCYDDDGRDLTDLAFGDAEDE